MATTEPEVRDFTEALDPDVEAALNPGEAQGFYRDTRECAALALQGGDVELLLSPPTPRPKKR
jgi:hypothetical protein